jgi:hypothetical protein
MSLVIDGDAADLTENPVVRQRLWPEASTAKVGISPASAVRGSAGTPISAADAMQMEMVRERLATAPD